MNNAWAALAAQTPEGALLQCRKGKWTLDDASVETGPNGLKAVVLMDSAVVGEVSFDDAGEKINENVGRIEDGFMPPARLTPGYSPSTSVVALGLDEAHLGQAMTFRASSWGGRRAFGALIGGYVRFRQRVFPVVTLGAATRERGGNDVEDPLFNVVEWRPRRDFGGGDDPPPQLPAPEPLMTITSGKPAARPIDDDIPF
jgi:hypothetical protein